VLDGLLVLIYLNPDEIPFQDWIITAAHCFCGSPHNCTDSKPAETNVKTDQVTIYLAQHDISRKKSKPVRELPFLFRQFIIN